MMHRKHLNNKSKEDLSIKINPSSNTLSSSTTQDQSTITTTQQEQQQQQQQQQSQQSQQTQLLHPDIPYSVSNTLKNIATTLKSPLVSPLKKKPSFQGSRDGLNDASSINSKRSGNIIINDNNGHNEYKDDDDDDYDDDVQDLDIENRMYNFDNHNDENDDRDYQQAYLQKKKLSSNVMIIISIVLWYIFSVSISLYNKWMFNPNLKFSYPILITSCHQLILFILSGTVLYFNKSFRLVDPKQSYLMNWKSYLFQIFPCSLSSAADIGLGNYSFKFITLSLYTMVKSSLIVFVLIWGVIFKLEKLSMRLCIIVAIMTVGVMMMVYGQQDQQKYPGDDPNTMFIGCFLVLSSACMSGLRWALTQILLKRNAFTKNPILTIFYISPSMCLVLVIIGGFVEGWLNFYNANIWHEKGFFLTVILLIIPGILAFCMTLSEFTLLQHAPLLTLSIAGIFKEILTISISSIVFGDRLNWINFIGLVITLGDIMWYNYYRYDESKVKDYSKLNEDDIELRNV